MSDICKIKQKKKIKTPSSETKHLRVNVSRHTRGHISHLSVCVGVLEWELVVWTSGGPRGSPGRGELLLLSRLGELLLGDTQLLLDEYDDTLETKKPGERQPCKVGQERDKTTLNWERIDIFHIVPLQKHKYQCFLLEYL